MRIISLLVGMGVLASRAEERPGAWAVAVVRVIDKRGSLHSILVDHSELTASRWCGCRLHCSLHSIRVREVIPNAIAAHDQQLISRLVMCTHMQQLVSPVGTVARGARGANRTSKSLSRISGTALMYGMPLC